MLNFLKYYSQPEVAVIGSGPHNNNRYGEIINNCNTVIRFNNYQIKGYEQFIGTKTTIWMYSSVIWYKVKSQQNSCEQVWVVGMPRLAIRKEVTHNALTEKKAHLRIIDEREFRNMQNVLQLQHPSTGLMGLYLAIQEFKGPILVSGFNGFQKNKNLHYYNNNWDYQIHDSIKERQWLQQWRSQGLIVPNIMM